MTLAVAIIVLLLMYLIYEDFRYRAISSYVFVLLGLLLLILATQNRGWETVLVYIGYNVVYTLLLVLTMTIYVSLRSKMLTNIFKRHFGLGDLLFLVVISCWFDLINFVIFNLISFLFAIIAHISLKKVLFKYNAYTTVPLAGMQAFCFLPILIFNL